MWPSKSSTQINLLTRCSHFHRCINPSTATLSLRCAGQMSSFIEFKFYFSSSTPWCLWDSIFSSLPNPIIIYPVGFSSQTLTNNFNSSDRSHNNSVTMIFHGPYFKQVPEEYHLAQGDSISKLHWKIICNSYSHRLPQQIYYCWTYIKLTQAGGNSL